MSPKKLKWSAPASVSLSRTTGELVLFLIVTIFERPYVATRCLPNDSFPGDNVRPGAFTALPSPDPEPVPVSTWNFLSVVTTNSFSPLG